MNSWGTQWETWLKGMNLKTFTNLFCHIQSDASHSRASGLHWAMNTSRRREIKRNQLTRNCPHKATAGTVKAANYVSVVLSSEIQRHYYLLSFSITISSAYLVAFLMWTLCRSRKLRRLGWRPVWTEAWSDERTTSPSWLWKRMDVTWCLPHHLAQFLLTDMPAYYICQMKWNL